MIKEFNIDTGILISIFDGLFAGGDQWMSW